MAKRLSTFAPRLVEDVCLFHEGGGVYRVLSNSGTHHTKHVRAFEKDFPGTGRLGVPGQDVDLDSYTISDQGWYISSTDSANTDGEDEGHKQELRPLPKLDTDNADIGGIDEPHV